MPRINTKAALKKEFKAKNLRKDVDLNELYEKKKKNVKKRRKL